MKTIVYNGQIVGIEIKTNKNAFNQPIIQIYDLNDLNTSPIEILTLYFPYEKLTENEVIIKSEYYQLLLDSNYINESHKIINYAGFDYPVSYLKL